MVIPELIPVYLKMKVLIVPASVRNSLRLHIIAPLCNEKYVSGTTFSSSKNF